MLAHLLRFSTRCVLSSFKSRAGLGLGHEFSVLRNFRATRCLEGVTQVKMPSLSPTMTEGTIVKWSKTEGEAIAAGDVICEIQTDKAVVSLEHDDDGILAKILMPENSADVKVGSLIALIVDEGEDWKNVQVPQTTPETTVSPVETGSPDRVVQANHDDGHAQESVQRLLGPAVKTLLQKYGLRPDIVSGTGPKGVILKGDVLRHVESKNLSPVEQKPHVEVISTPVTPPTKKSLPPPSGGYVDIELTNMRRTIAKRLTQSKSTVPHAYSVQRCNIDRLTKLRKHLQSSGIKVSVNDFLIKLVSNALSNCPSVNVAWAGENVMHKPEVDISVAVATDNGLITPIVTNVKEKDVLQVSEQIKALVEKARAGKLQPHEFMGGSFSISNLGMFGIHHFTAIINPPQCAILAVGGGELSLGKDGRPTTSIGVQLSYDGSAIHETDAAKFLAILKHEIENVSETSIGIYNLQNRLEMIELSA